MIYKGLPELFILQGVRKAFHGYTLALLGLVTLTFSSLSYYGLLVNLNKKHS